MRKSRFTEGQMVKILRETDKTPVVRGRCEEARVTAETVYQWKRKYGGMDVDDAKRLNSLEFENTKPKKMLADRMFEIEV
jgi:putative transposase